MLDIEPLVRHLAPGVLAGPHASVACICTTRPKYLVFDGGQPAGPACVVEFGETARLTRTAHVLSELSRRMPGRVPAPICCAPWQNGTSVLIQQGLRGMPWFRVADGLPDTGAWRALLDQATGALLRLHRAVRDVPDWTTEVSVHWELQRQAAAARRGGIDLSRAILRRLQDWEETGDRSALRSCRQHGDFSLNNLLVSPKAIAIIDFDEFGGTAVPLHDAFGLALSVPLSQEQKCPLSRTACLTECIGRAAGTDGIDASWLPPLLMHHLLWRINQCVGLERRARLQRVLLDWADELSQAPETFFPN